jgi:peptidyl-prolyl cis-trans isomerase SurA
MRAWWTVLAACMVLAGGPGLAQNPFAPAYTVNTGVITYYDIEQRVALLDALGASGDLRELAIEQLTDDRLKLQAAEGLGVALPEGALEAGLDEFATSRGLTTERVLEVLEARDIDRQTLDDFIEAGLVWREVVTQRFRARALPSEAELDAALEFDASTPQEALVLAEIALPFAERGEAATLELAERLSRELNRGGDFEAAVRRYSRSGSAADGGRLPPVMARNLPPALRTEVLLLTPGQVSDPIPISGGLALIKLLDIRQERPGDASELTEEEQRAQLREQLFAQRISSFGQGYLQELRRDALIVEE